MLSGKKKFILYLTFFIFTISFFSNIKITQAKPPIPFKEFIVQNISSSLSVSDSYSNLGLDLISESILPATASMALIPHTKLYYLDLPFDEIAFPNEAFSSLSRFFNLGLSFDNPEPMTYEEMLVNAVRKFRESMEKVKGMGEMRLAPYYMLILETISQIPIYILSNADINETSGLVSLESLYFTLLTLNKFTDPKFKIDSQELTFDLDILNKLVADLSRLADAPGVKTHKSINSAERLMTTIDWLIIYSYNHGIIVLGDEDADAYIVDRIIPEAKILMKRLGFKESLLLRSEGEILSILAHGDLITWKSPVRIFSTQKTTHDHKTGDIKF